MSSDTASLNIVFRSTGRMPSAEIVFVHGLDGSWDRTWRHPDLPAEDPIGWPAWLGAQANAQGIDCNVWSFAYPAASMGWRGQTLPMFDRAGNFLELLDLRLRGYAPVLFVCHSLGGLMVKRTLVLAQGEPEGSAKANFLQRTRGILFLGTPHQGSGVAGVLAMLPRLFSRATVTTNELTRTQAELRSLNRSFLRLLRQQRWLVHQFGEGRDTYGVRVVDEHSANCGSGDADFQIAEAEDHLSLPKVADREAVIYLRAMRMLEDIVAPLPAPPAWQPTQHQRALLQALTELGFLNGLR